MSSSYFGVESQMNTREQIFKKEELNASVINGYFDDISKCRAYLFYDYGAYYPLMNKNRRQKLWGYYEDRFGLPVQNVYEEFVELKRYWMYYGLASINIALLGKYLDTFPFCHNAYIVLINDNSVNLVNLTRATIKISDRDEGINYSRLINLIVNAKGILISRIGSYESIFVFSYI